MACSIKQVIYESQYCDLITTSCLTQDNLVIEHNTLIVNLSIFQVAIQILAVKITSVNGNSIVRNDCKEDEWHVIIASPFLINHCKWQFLCFVQTIYSHFSLIIESRFEDTTWICSKGPCSIFWKYYLWTSGYNRS